MIIKTKLKCIHCNSIVEDTGVCTCGKVKLSYSMIVEGKLHTDYVDITPRVLNEG